MSGTPRPPGETPETSLILRTQQTHSTLAVDSVHTATLISFKTSGSSASSYLRSLPDTIMASNLALRRTGIATVAAASYGAAVYFTYQFMTVNVEKNAEAFSGDTTSSLSSSSCNCHSSVTSPERTQTFQKIAKVYDDQISRDEFVMGLPLLRRALLYFNASGDVLEVGAGTGRNLDYYPKNVQKVVLTDSSDQMLLQAREKIKNHSYKDKFQLFVADAQNISKYYPENTFDVVVDTFGLCSFDDPVEVLKELQRVCKPDGKILLLEHGRSKKYEGLTNYLDKNAERHASNWGCVWNRDLDQIIDDAGLVVEKLDTWHFGTTYYVVTRPSAKIKMEKKDADKEKKEEDLKSNRQSSGLKGVWKTAFGR